MNVSYTNKENHILNLNVISNKKPQDNTKKIFVTNIETKDQNDQNVILKS